MPIYEYHCADCDSTIEVLQRSAADQPECPGCHSHELERLLSVPAAPSIRGGSARSTSPLPMTSGESCGAPRCCGGGCDF